MGRLLDPGVATQDRDLSGWVLLESSLGRVPRHDCCSLLVQRTSLPGRAEEIRLPVPPDGRIRELILLPPDVAGLIWQPPEHRPSSRSQLSAKPVGRFERTWRMANRVLRNWVRLSGNERLTSGLSLWRALIDLPGAYRIASRFRAHVPYEEWIECFDRVENEDCRAIQAHIARFASHPRFHVLVMAGSGSQEAIQSTLASLRGQLYREFTCWLVDSAGVLDSFGVETGSVGTGIESCVVAGDSVADWLRGFNALLAEQHEGRWVMLLRAGDVLPAHSLYWHACEILAHPDAAIVYSDDDALDAQGRRCQPRFKPDWSLAHFRSTHYVGDATMLRGEAVAAAGGLNLDDCRYGIYDLLLRIIDRVRKEVRHVPAVLVHRQYEKPSGSCTESFRPPEKEPGMADWQADALRAHLARSGIEAEVRDTWQGCRRIRYLLPQTPPLVSIIVPTRDAPALIRQCVESLLAKTTYPRFELLVVDNQSVDRQALDYLAEVATRPTARLLHYDRPFSFSAINNFAARQARGSVLCLLNNDTEVITPDWLDEMVGHLLQPLVGVSGAKLYYPDGRVQHAGDVVGPGGCANHLHSSIGRDEPGYCNRAVVAQDLSAVTAACLVTWRDLYLKLGGLDEERLAVAFNDVDYCLRVRRAGYRVVWTPHAELYHHESVSRGADRSWPKRFRAKREVAIMRRRWKHVMERDPFYNPNLSYQRPDFSWSGAPRVKKPWR